MGSPAIARSMFPSFLKLNTRIGNWFSRHMPMAVMSMTLSESRMTLVVREGFVKDGMGVFFGVRGIDAVDAGRFEQNVDAELLAAQGRGGVGRDEGAAGSGGKDDHAAALEMREGPPADERFGDFLHADRGQEPGGAAFVLERILQGQAVDHGCGHAHVVGGRFLDHVRAARELGTAEDVSAAHHDRELHVTRGHSRGLRAIRLISSTLSPP